MHARKSITLAILAALLTALLVPACAEAPEDAVLGVWYLHRVEAAGMSIPLDEAGAPRCAMVFARDTVTFYDEDTAVWTAPWAWETPGERLTVARSFGQQTVWLVPREGGETVLCALETALGDPERWDIYGREPLPEADAEPSDSFARFLGEWRLAGVRDSQEQAFLPATGSLSVTESGLTIAIDGLPAIRMDGLRPDGTGLTAAGGPASARLEMDGGRLILTLHTGGANEKVTFLCFERDGAAEDPPGEVHGLMHS